MSQKKNSKVLKKIPEDENDHTSCIRPGKSEILKDLDAQLLDIEGDPLEEFEVTKSDNVDKVFSIYKSVQRNFSNVNECNRCFTLSL